MTDPIALVRPGSNGQVLWIATPLPDRLLIEYGPQGKKLKKAEVPISQCAGGDPVRESSIRAEVKLKEGKGYRHADIGTLVLPKPEPTHAPRDRLKMPPSAIGSRTLTIAKRLAELLNLTSSSQDEGSLQTSHANYRCSLELGGEGTIDVSELPANLRVFVSAVAITCGSQLINSKGQTVEATPVFQEAIKRLPVAIQQAVESLDIIASVSRLAAASGIRTLGF